MNTPPSPTPLEALRLKFPRGATVAYKDQTLLPRHRARTGEVLDAWITLHGTSVITVKMSDSLLDTLPENLTVIRIPRPTNQDRTTP